MDTNMDTNTDKDTDLDLAYIFKKYNLFTWIDRENMKYVTYLPESNGKMWNV
jgi:hypothetical protein